MARIGIGWLRRWRKHAQFAPSDAERRQLSEHLFYEVQMTFDLADVMNQAFATQPTSPSAQLALNALLEAFTIHVRQLVDFFWIDRSPKRKVTEQDAFASDYFSPSEWKQMRPARPQRLNRVMSAKVGWGVAHLTYGRARSTPADKRWEPIRMCAALEPTVRLFIDNVDAAQFESQWFTEMEPCLDRFKAKYGQVTP